MLAVGIEDSLMAVKLSLFAPYLSYSLSDMIARVKDRTVNLKR